MQNLKLCTVGTRHVASVERDGKHEDVGEFDEAHLRAYVATLPGSYTVLPSQRSSPQLSVRGSGVRFADAVEARKKRLLSSDSELSELEAHRRASLQIAKEDPSLLSAYRADVQEI
jgi:hypothetical protein